MKDSWPIHILQAKFIYTFNGTEMYSCWKIAVSIAHCLWDYSDFWWNSDHWVQRKMDSHQVNHYAYSYWAVLIDSVKVNKSVTMQRLFEWVTCILESCDLDLNV